jgi:PAS domain S-box-containing protein
LLSILTALAMLLCVGVFSAIDWLDYHRDRDAVLAARRIFAHTSALSIALGDAESGQRGFLLTGDETFLQPYEKALPAIAGELDILDAASAENSSRRDQSRRLRALIKTELAEMARTIQLRRQGDIQKSLALVQTGSARTLMDSIRQLTAQMRAEENSISEARSLAARTRSDRAHLIALISCGILLIILGLGARTIHIASTRREGLIAQLAELTTAFDKAQGLILGLDGTILSWSSGAEALYGWSSREAVGRSDHELLQTEAAQSFEEIQSELMDRGHWAGECKQKRSDGSSIWVSSYRALHRNSRGEPVSVVKVNNDITALKRAGEALLTSEATIRSLFESANEGILTVNREGRIVDANARIESLFGYSRTQLIGASVETLLPESLRGGHVGHRADFARDPDPRPMGHVQDLMAQRRDGSAFPVEISLSHVADGASGGLAMAFISDITARKKADWERDCLVVSLENALSEKTTLLKEVHHRVKNNLAVIAALLGMQADGIEDAGAKMALAESQQRVASMALIHEYLYGSENLDRVNFGKYVRQLSGELCIAYPVRPDLVTIGIEVEEIELPVDQAIPCGLILNELLSNALKYAFPGGRRGKIDVHFSRMGSGQLLLSCGDDGAGMPSGFDWQDLHSMGLRIVSILTKQLDGTLILDRNGIGSRFELKIPYAG